QRPLGPPRPGVPEEGVGAYGGIRETLLRQIELEPGLARFRLEAGPQAFGLDAVLAPQHRRDVGARRRGVRGQKERTVTHRHGEIERREHPVEALVAQEAPGTDHVREQVDGEGRRSYGLRFHRRVSMYKRRIGYRRSGG